MKRAFGLRHPVAFWLAAAALASASCKGKPAEISSQEQASTESVNKGKEAAPALDEGKEEQAWAPLPLGTPFPQVKQPKGVPLLYRKGSIALNKGELDEARQNLDEAISEDPFYENALWKRARLHAREGQVTETLSVLERLLALNFVRFAPLMATSQWLKDLRGDEAAWKPFEEKIEAYRRAWSEALTGPAAFFVQGRFQKVEQTDLSGEPLDLRFVRGIPMAWSLKVRRFLAVGGSHDVAGFLLDRERKKLYLVEWKKHPEARPGVMGETAVSCLDLDAMEFLGGPVKLAADADAVRLSLDEEGKLLVEVVPAEEPSTVEDLPKAAAAKEPEEESVEGGKGEPDEEEAEEEAEQEPLEEEESVESAPQEQNGEPPAADEPEGSRVKTIDWEKKELLDAEAAEDQAWALVITLGSTSGPTPESPADVAENPPKAKRGGACVWLEEDSALCIEPTKKGGRWHTIELRPAEGEILKLTPDCLPIVQY
jgi:tetratricopeptide (TPR) repeat protein